MDRSRLTVSGTPALSCYTIQSTALPSPLLDALSLVLLGTAVASGVRTTLYFAKWIKELTRVNAGLLDLGGAGGGSDVGEGQDEPRVGG